MSRSIAPATVSSPRNDLVTYRISDTSPVDPSSPPGYAERQIHSSIYKSYHNINSVVHSHAESVIPFTILKDVPLKPVYHMAGFLGSSPSSSSSSAPIFDIPNYFQETDPKDMLVRSQHLGDALASHFETCNYVTLMRGHGFTAIGERIETAVFRAIYTAKKAAIQTTALTLRAAVFGPGSGTLTGSSDGIGEIKYLSEQEARDSTELTIWPVQRPWELWAREVEKSGLYENLA